jgi:hypothetical protein
LIIKSSSQQEKKTVNDEEFLLSVLVVFYNLFLLLCIYSLDPIKMVQNYKPTPASSWRKCYAAADMKLVVDKVIASGTRVFFLGGV